MKNVELKRFTGCGKCTPGALFVDGNLVSFSVENTEKIFPAGEYELVLTSTARSMPPGYEGMAYEVREVEGRTLIKGHVANFYYELEGCFAPNPIVTGKHLFGVLDRE